MPDCGRLVVWVMQAPASPFCTDPGLLIAKPSHAVVQMPRFPCGPGPSTVPHSSCPTLCQRQRSKRCPLTALLIFSQLVAPWRKHVSKPAELQMFGVWVMQAPFESHTGQPVPALVQIPYCGTQEITVLGVG